MGVLCEQILVPRKVPAFKSGFRDRKKTEALSDSTYFPNGECESGSGTPPLASEPLTEACTSRRISKYWLAMKSV